jgi:hypothetical protein
MVLGTLLLSFLSGIPNQSISQKSGHVKVRTAGPQVGKRESLQALSGLCSSNGTGLSSLPRSVFWQAAIHGTRPGVDASSLVLEPAKAGITQKAEGVGRSFSAPVIEDHLVCALQFIRPRWIEFCSSRRDVMFAEAVADDGPQVPVDLLRAYCDLVDLQ